MASWSKGVYFNTAEDKDKIDFANSLPNWSGWVKDRINEAMQDQAAATAKDLLVWTIPQNCHEK